MQKQLEIELKPHFESEFVIKINALILDTLVPKLPTARVEVKRQNIKLADPTFRNPGRIGLVIGSDYYAEIIKEGFIRIDKRLIAQNSNLGWLISGATTVKGADNNLKVSCAVIEKTVEQLLEDKKEDESTPNLFEEFGNTTKRTKEGGSCRSKTTRN